MSEEQKSLLSRVFSPGKLRLLGLALAVIGGALAWKVVEGAPDSASSERSSPESERREIVTDSQYAREAESPSLLTPLSTRSVSPPVGERTDASGQPILRATPVETGGGGIVDARWSDAALRLGFSFFAAMVVGSFLRTFVKTMTIVLVVGGVLYWFLVKQGLIEPVLALDEGFFQGAQAWAGEQSRTAIDFMKGELPATAAAAVGLFLGLRR